MNIEFGHAAAFMALGMAVLAAGSGLCGREALAARASVGCAGLLAAAMTVLISAFAVSDFSVALVAGHSSISKPLIYKLAASWGNHEGSMLLWCLVSAGYAAAATVAMPSGTLRARALGVQGGLTALFLLYLLIASNPFDRLDPVPMDGTGLNPLLQHPALAFHPPILYVGYVGMSFVFSLAVARLTLPEKLMPNALWAYLARPWAIVASAMLTIGILLGALWAYYELGWGGWWFWDPVENASLIPWLTGMALIHSLTVTARNGRLAGWTLLLAIVCFSAALFGAFLVRSGVLTSVHAFANSPEKGVLLIFGTVLVAGGALALYARRVPTLTGGRTHPWRGREMAIATNNLFLCTAAATVLAGTIYPLAVEALTGGKVSVGPPYFDLTVAPLVAVALLLAPIAQRSGFMRIGTPAMLAVLAAAGLVFAASGTLWTVAGTTLGVWLIAGTANQAIHDIRMRGVRAVLIGPVSIIGVTLAHIGLGVFVIGAVSESAGRIERTVVLAPGETTSLADWTVRMTEMKPAEGVNFDAHVAVFEVVRDGRSVRLSPEKRRYFPTGAPTTETAIDRTAGGHFHIALGEPLQTRPGAWSVRLSFNPLVDWVFFGMILVATGVLAALLRRVRMPSASRVPS